MAQAAWVFFVWLSCSAVSLRSPTPLTVRPLPLRFTILFRLRTGPNVLVRAFATVLLTHVVAFVACDSPCPRSTTASQAREPDSPPGSRSKPPIDPLRHPCRKARATRAHSPTENQK